MSKENNKFPVLGWAKYENCPKFIRWDALDDDWAKHVHSQDLEKLASRGGLCPEELVFNINKLQWGTKVDKKFAVNLINKTNAEDEATHANELDAETVAQLERFKDQLIIVLIKRLGGVVDIPIAEADDTGQDILLMQSDPVNGFHFEMQKKN